MKLHVFPRSPNAKKVMMAAQEAGVPVELEIVDLHKGEQRRPEFLALNPNGKMPVLEYDDGTSLWESNAITNQLAELGGGKLFPGGRDRFQIGQWQFWEMAHWAPEISKFIRATFFDVPLDRETEAPALQKVASVLNGQLAGRDWLVSNQMTTADISVAAMLCYREVCDLPLGDVPNIDRWMERISQLESWKEVTREPEPA